MTTIDAGSVSLKSSGLLPSFLTQALHRFRTYLGEALQLMGVTFKTYLKIDWPSGILLTVFLLMFVPLLTRVTDNPQLISAFSNDEIPLCMALDGMRAWPFGNPGNYLLAAQKHGDLPAYWQWGDSFVYNWFPYYGGTLYILPFFLYWPMSLLGAEGFPTVPILLRIMTLLSSMGALLVTYNLAKKYVGVAAAVIAFLFLLTQEQFIQFTRMIHPDTLQQFFALFALPIAIHHARTGSWASLYAMGILTGLVHGTKCGGPWMVPLAMVSVWLGLERKGESRLISFSLLKAFVGRMLMVALTAALGFFVSTPYALPHSHNYYWKTIRNLYSFLKQSPLSQVTFMTWFDAFAAAVGPVFMSVFSIGIIALGLRMLRNRLSDERTLALLLCLVLAASQLVWYGVTGKFWVVASYFLAGYAIVGIFIGDVATLARKALDSVTPKAVGVTCISLFAFWLVSMRWFTPATYILTDHLSESNTVVAISQWAKQTGGIPKNARIMYDDIAYFDPVDFPNAQMLGTSMTYVRLFKAEPEYFILSSSMYDAPHVAELIRTQKFDKPYDFLKGNTPSVKLYQDLAGSKIPGKTKVPGVEFIRDIAPVNIPVVDSQCFLQNGVDVNPACPALKPYEWLPASLYGPVSASLASVPLMGPTLNTFWQTKVGELNMAAHWLRARNGEAQVRLGPTLKIFKIGPGFAHPIALGSYDHYIAAAAFDGVMNTAWKGNDAANESALGYDYGAGPAKQVERLNLVFPVKFAAPAEMTLEASDNGKSWQSVERYALDRNAFTVVGHKNQFWQLEVPLKTPQTHRYWRVKLPAVAKGKFLKVSEVAFLSTHEASPVLR